MTNEERIAKITALEETLLSELDTSNCGEKMTQLLTCDNLYRAYQFRRIEEARDAAVPESSMAVREKSQTTAVETAAVETVTEETEGSTEASEDSTEASEGSATKDKPESYPTFSYMRTTLTNRQNHHGVNVGKCIEKLGYKKLSDVPESKYHELLKLAGADE